MRHAKKVAATAVLAATLAGGAAGFAFTSSSPLAGAEEAALTATTSATTQDPTARPDPAAKLAETLKPLVDNNTINQSQADAVIAAINAARPARGEGGPGGGRGPGGDHAAGPRGKNVEVAATAIGVTTDELKAGLKAGTTVAAQAEAKNVDPQTVIDALTAELDARLSEQVTAGKLTQEQADTRKTESVERITKFVNEVPPVRAERPAQP